MLQKLHIHTHFVLKIYTNNSYYVTHASRVPLSLIYIILFFKYAKRTSALVTSFQTKCFLFSK